MCVAALVLFNRAYQHLVLAIQAVNLASRFNFLTFVIYFAVKGSFEFIGIDNGQLDIGFSKGPSTEFC